MSIVRGLGGLVGRRWWIAVALVPLTVCANAAEPRAQTVSQSFPFAADGSLRLDVPSGTVEITGAQGAGNLQVSGRLAAGQRLRVDGDAQHLHLEVLGSPEGWRGWLHALLHGGSRSGSQLTLRLPAAAAVEFRSGSADLRARGLDGALSADTASGDVWLDGGSAVLTVNTASGDVYARDRAAQETRISSASGDLQLHELGGRLHLRTASGDIRLRGGTVSRLSASSASGDLVVALSPASGAEIKLASVSGDVHLELTGGGGAHLALSTISGDIGADMPLRFDDRRTRARGSYGDGGSKVTVSTVSGDINLDVQPRPAAAGSVSEVPRAGHHHRHAVLVSRSDHLLVAY